MKTILAALVTFSIMLSPFAVQAKDAHEGHQHAGKAEVQKVEKTPQKAFDSPQKEGTKAVCPVSGETFTITKDTQFSEYKGKYVYFCCASCKPMFDKNPEKYLKDSSPEGGK